MRGELISVYKRLFLQGEVHELEQSFHKCHRWYVFGLTCPGDVWIIRMVLRHRLGGNTPVANLHDPD